jgi:two-component system CheB/CheR fusion protein
MTVHERMIEAACLAPVTVPAGGRPLLACACGEWNQTRPPPSPEPARAEGARPDEPSPARARPTRVLIVEDNLDFAESLRMLLTLSGCEVEEASNGPTGIEKARSFRPDVVLCDIGLPGMSGYDVARTIRADPILSSTVLVAVTGYALPQDRRSAAEAGFDQHLSKPISAEQLEAVVASAGRRARR